MSEILKYQNQRKLLGETRLNDSPIVADKQAEPARNITKVDTKIAPISITSSQSSTPESPGTPTQVTLSKAPTPWMQNKIKPQEELPEWAKRTSVNKTAGGDPSEDFSPVYVQVQQPTSPQCSQARPKQEQRQYPVPQSPQQTRPQQLSQQPQQRGGNERRNADSVASQQINSPSYNERVVPIRVSWSKLISNIYLPKICPFLLFP